MHLVRMKQVGTQLKRFFRDHDAVLPLRLGPSGTGSHLGRPHPLAAQGLVSSSVVLTVR